MSLGEISYGPCYTVYYVPQVLVVLLVSCITVDVSGDLILFLTVRILGLGKFFR